MKKTQFTDALRNIWKQKVSFLSILIIAVLGVTIFLGIDYTSYGMRENGTILYDSMNYRDVEVISTLLFSEKDLEDLKNLEGVADAEPVRFASAKAESGDVQVNLSILSLTERINVAELREGRLPVAENECALEQELAETLHLSVGDTLVLSDTGTNTFLKENSLVITGLLVHPDHVNILAQDPLYVMVAYDAFDGEALNGCFMKAELSIEKPKGINRFSEAYYKLTEAVLDRIEDMSPACIRRRQEDLEAQLRDGYAQIEQAKERVRDTIRNPFNTAFPTDAENRLIHWAQVREPDLTNPDETARYLWITENIRIDLYQPLDVFFHNIIYSESFPEKLLAAIYKAALDEEPPQVNGEYDYEAIRSGLENAVVGTSSGYGMLVDGCRQWDAGYETYRSVTSDGGKWLAFDVRGNSSFVQMGMGSGNFSNLRGTFALMFVLVGALVIFATVGKMVDEQRIQIGTTKALGFFNREIFAKYLGFGLTATLIGTVAGFFLAYFFLEPFMLSGFNKYYRFDMIKPVIHLPTTFLAFGATILLSTGAVWLACTKLLRQPAIVLMKPKIPGTKKKKASGKSRMSLYSRLILMNIRTDLKRVIVTVVSVAGCCALVVVGMTMRSSVRGCVSRQYAEITDYDYRVTFDPSNETAQENLENILEEAGTEYTGIYVASVTYRVDTLQAAELSCGDISSIGEFYHLYEWKTGKEMTPTNRGVLVQRRFAEKFGLLPGSTFEIAIGGTRTASVQVAGVFENFIGRSVVMSREYFEKAFGELPEDNTFLVRLGKADAGTLETQLKTVNGFEGLTASDSDRSIIESSTSMMDTIVLLFIFMAAIMAGVVQLNLTTMYVMQKKREMTIMRVNGFTVKEVLHYILRETVVTTILGILLGIGVGSGFAYSIIRTLEQPFLQFDRRISILAWVVGVVLTIVFTVIVNYIALRKTKNLKLTDVA